MSKAIRRSTTLILTLWILGLCSFSACSKPAAEGSRRQVYLTREDLKKINSVKFEETRCSNCANTVLVAPGGPAAQPPCPATRPNCIAICDSDDPLDGIGDQCSTLKWECLGCDGSGGDLCCTESGGTCTWTPC